MAANEKPGGMDYAGCICMSGLYVLFWIVLVIVWNIVVHVIRNPGPLRFGL